MVEVLTPELTFGRYIAGIGKDSVSGQTRRLIWIDPSAEFTTYLQFKNSYFRSGTSLNPSISALPGFSFTRTGERYEFNASGAAVDFLANAAPLVTGVGYIPRSAQSNLYLNAGAAANLVTQGVAVTAQAYTVSFVGTGTITFSGAFVGSLVGTGATTRVFQTFTPSAATLTSTVSGNVTYATLQAGTFANGGAVIPTAGVSANAGVDAMALTSNLVSGNQIIWARANMLAQAVGNFYLATFANANNGGPAEAITFIFQNNIPVVQLTSSSALIVNQNGAGQAAGIFNLFALRSGGTWRCGMVVNGVLTYFGTAVTAAFPSSLTFLLPGQFGAALSPLNNVLEGVYSKPGIFTDTDIINLLANT